jgi:hypothetical protein
MKNQRGGRAPALPLFISGNAQSALPAARIRGCNGAMKINVQTRQFLRDLAFTAVAAVGTGAAVSAVAVAVVVLFAR